MKVIPPGGFAGFSQMTRASQMALAQGASKKGDGLRMVRTASKRKGTKAQKRYATNKRSLKKADKVGTKLAFGSPAWRKKYAKAAAKGRRSAAKKRRG